MASSIVKQHPKLARFRKSIETRTKIKDVFLEPSTRLEYINSGSTVLNMLMGGSKLPDGSFVCPGYPKGRIVEIYGRESSGKSTLALSALAHAIDNGGKGNGCGLYVDLECAVVDKYAKKIGVDFMSGNADRAMPHSFEETEALVTNAALNGIDLVVVDSVAGLVSNREVSRDTSDKTQKQGVAEVPRLMSNWMPKLQGIIARTGTTVIFLNQTRDKIGAMGYTEEALKSTTGGNALKFWASIRMLLKPKVSTKAKRFNPLTKTTEDVQIATDIEIKMIKNKVDAKQGHTGLITVRYGVGVDELRTMLNVAEAYKIAKVSKNAKKQEVWSFKGPQSGKVIESVGVERFRLDIQREPEALREMLEFCRQKLVDGYDMISDEELAALADGAVQKRDGEDDDYESTDAPAVQFDEDEELDDGSSPDPVTAAPLVDMADLE
jgi:recombination protein RecA